VIETVGDFAASQIVAQTNDEPAVEETKISDESWETMASLLHQSGAYYIAENPHGKQSERFFFFVADYQRVEQILAETQFTMDTPDLIGLLYADPHAVDESTRLRFIANSDTTTSFHQMGVFSSETIHNDVIIRNGRLRIYSGCKSLSGMRDGNGIACLLSPVEGVVMNIFDDRSDISRGDFGGVVRADADEVVPTTSGRIRLSTTIDFVCAPHLEKKNTFLHYPNRDRQPNDRILDGPNAVYRPHDLIFTDHMQKLKGDNHTRACMNNARMVPLQVIIPATPLHRLPREIAMQHQ
jgi:hypothetical protein